MSEDARTATGLKAVIAQLRIKIGKLEMENQSFRSRDNHNRQMIELHESNERLRTLLTAAEGHHALYKSVIAELKVKNEAIFKDNVQIVEKNDKLSKQNTKLSKKNDELSKQNTKLSENYNDLANYAERQQQQIHELKIALDTKKEAKNNPGWHEMSILGTLRKSKDDEILFRECYLEDTGMYIDARIFRNGNPTRKGLCLTPDMFKLFVRKAQSIINRI